MDVKYGDFSFKNEKLAIPTVIYKHLSIRQKLVQF